MAVAVSRNHAIKIYQDDQLMHVFYGHSLKINDIAYRLAEGERKILASVSGKWLDFQMIVFFLFLERQHEYHVIR
jgi:hypothetical protein